MKTILKTLPWIMALAHVNAQDYTDTSSTSTTTTTSTSTTGSLDTVTSYYTSCPNSTTTTAPIIGSPNELTRTGDDGRTTIYRTETTILPHMCPDDDGVCGATYVLSRDCPCTAAPKSIWTSDECPEGFTTSAVECTACARNGGPATVTVTVPESNGPYATVTPKYGSPVNNPTDICEDETASATNAPNSAAWTTVPAAQPSDRYGSPSAATNNTPPSYEPYTGAAGRLDMMTGLSLAGTAVVGALAVLL